MMEISPQHGRVPPPTGFVTVPYDYVTGITTINYNESPPSIPIENRLKQNTHQSSQSIVRYAHPDVTDTSGRYPQPSSESKEWPNSHLAYGLLSIPPDLASGSSVEESPMIAKESRELDKWTENIDNHRNYQPISPPSHHSSMCMIPQMTSIEARLTDALGLSCDDPWLSTAGGRRLSRSLEDLPTDIQDHILRCQCTCDHMGYGNFSGDMVKLKNGCQHLKTTISHQSIDEENESMKEVKPNRCKHKNNSKDGGFGTSTRVWVCLVMVLAAVAGVGVGVPLALRLDPGASIDQRLQTVKTILRETPLFDGHNDLPWNIRKFMHNKLHSFNFTAELNKMRPWSRSSWSHTDLPRLREGMVGAQFWVSYVPCQSKTLNAVQLTIEQIDLIKRLIEQYPNELRFASSAEEVEDAFKEGRIASLIGVEGGHAIQNSLGVLRSLRDLGVRYLTLTHTCSTAWAECARAQESDPEDPHAPRGLTLFGKTIVKEMNRLGLVVDLSHTSQATMRSALDTSKAPIMFSHSSVYAICKNPRNIPDDVLRKVKKNNGIVMISFYNLFLTCSEEAEIKDVIEHINHVRKIAGVDHVGIGADYDGINMLPKGLKDVSGYPNLFAELLSDPKWTAEDLRKLAGHNLLRVMRDVEQVRRDLRHQKITPYEDEMGTAYKDHDTSCFYKFTRDNDDKH